MSFVGKKIKIFFNTSVSIEGVCKEYCQEHIILINNINDGWIYIKNPDEKIIFIQILPTVDNTEIKPFSLPKEPEIDIKNIPAKDLKQEYNLKKLSELKNLQQQEYKKQLIKEMREFHLNKDMGSKYEYPKFFIKDNTTEEIAGSNGTSERRLSKVQIRKR